MSNCFFETLVIQVTLINIFNYGAFHCPSPYTISPVPLVHQLNLGVGKPIEAVVLLHAANVDQPAPVQLALHQRLVPGVGSVREQVLVTLLMTEETRL